MDVDDPDVQLQSRLEHGQRRVQSATPGSPEWDAAMANTDALEHQIIALRPVSSAEGDHVVSRLGPIVLEDGCVIHGTIAALGPNGEALRREISRIPGRAHSQHTFVEELAALVSREGFILETESSHLELSFYAWDSERH